MAKQQKPPSPFEDYIRQYCKNNHITIETLADLIGVSRGTIYNAFKPTHCPSMSLIIQLAHIMNVHQEVLMRLKWPDVVINYYPIKNNNFDQSKLDGAYYQRDASAFISETIPDGSIFPAGQTFVKTWTIQNVGEFIWENRFLQCVNELNPTQLSPLPNPENYILYPEQSLIPIPRTKPQQSITLKVSLTTPRISGCYVSYWKMVDENGKLCFPDGYGLSSTIFVKMFGVNFARL